MGCRKPHLTGWRSWAWGWSSTVKFGATFLFVTLLRMLFPTAVELFHKPILLGHEQNHQHRMCCYVICWLYFLVQVVWKDVGRYVFSSGMTSFLLCADSFSGKFPVLTDCFAGDLLLSYCFNAVFITKYLPRWCLHCKISLATIFTARYSPWWSLYYVIFAWGRVRKPEITSRIVKLL